MKVGGRGGKQRQRGGPDSSLRRRPESGPSRRLTESSHCRALVVEVLGADLTHHPGVHLLQDDAEGTLRGNASGDQSTASSDQDLPTHRGSDPAPERGTAAGLPGHRLPRAPGTPQPPTPLPCPPVTPPGRPQEQSASTPHPLRASRQLKTPKALSPQGPVTAIRLSHSARGMRRPYVRRLRPMSSHTGVVPARVREAHRPAPNLQGSALTRPDPRPQSSPVQPDLYPWAPQARPQRVPETPGPWGRGSGGTQRDRQRRPCWSWSGALVVLGLSPPIPTPPLATGLQDSPSR